MVLQLCLIPVGRWEGQTFTVYDWKLFTTARRFQKPESSVQNYTIRHFRKTSNSSYLLQRDLSFRPWLLWKFWEIPQDCHQRRKWRIRLSIVFCWYRNFYTCFSLKWLSWKLSQISKRLAILYKSNMFKKTPSWVLIAKFEVPILHAYKSENFEFRSNNN